MKAIWWRCAGRAAIMVLFWLLFDLLSGRRVLWFSLLIGAVTYTGLTGWHEVWSYRQRRRRRRRPYSVWSSFD